MRKKIITALILSACLVLGGCSLEESSSVDDLSRPYIGQYFCRRATIGNQNLLSDGEELILELFTDGTFKLTTSMVDGKGFSGKYETGEGEITFRFDDGHNYTFPMSSDGIELRYALGGRTIYALFSLQK